MKLLCTTWTLFTLLIVHHSNKLQPLRKYSNWRQTVLSLSLTGGNNLQPLLSHWAKQNTFFILLVFSRSTQLFKDSSLNLILRLTVFWLCGDSAPLRQKPEKPNILKCAVTSVYGLKLSRGTERGRPPRQAQISNSHLWFHALIIYESAFVGMASMSKS